MTWEEVQSAQRFRAEGPSLGKAARLTRPPGCPPARACTRRRIGHAGAMRHHHPLTRRLLWHPLVVAVPFGYLVCRTGLGRAGAGGVAGLAFVGLWLGLSVIDLLTSHR